jgi:hypothetical protein
MKEECQLVAELQLDIANIRDSNRKNIQKCKDIRLVSVNSAC